MQNTLKTVLIGEDEMEVRGYLEMALKCLGYSVELAQDGDEVLSCLQASRSEICAVLLDLTMPNRDGFVPDPRPDIACCAKDKAR